jgi:hypothetical protein
MRIGAFLETGFMVEDEVSWFKVQDQPGIPLANLYVSPNLVNPNVCLHIPLPPKNPKSYFFGKKFSLCCPTKSPNYPTGFGYGRQQGKASQSFLVTSEVP